MRRRRECSCVLERAWYLLAHVDFLAVLDHDVLAAVVHHAAPPASRVALLPAVGAVGGRGVLALALLSLFITFVIPVRASIFIVIITVSIVIPSTLFRWTVERQVTEATAVPALVESYFRDRLLCRFAI